MRRNSLLCTVLMLLAIAQIKLPAHRNSTEQDKTVTAGFITDFPKLKLISFVVPGITVTRYHPTVAECDADPTTLADGTKIKPYLASRYRYCAISRDLLFPRGPFNFGDQIYLANVGPHTGFWTIRDVTSKRFTKRVDILQGLPVKLELYEDARIVYKRWELDT